MALKSTIHKANLQIADMDRGYYRDHALTIARHPSENDERMMARILAFALHADDALAFGNGLSTNDEPDLWQKDLTGAIQLWIDVGLPDEKLVRKACARADRVLVLAYGRAVTQWWRNTQSTLANLDHLAIHAISATASQALAGLAQRNMQLQCTIQEGQIWIGTPEQSVSVELQTIKALREPLR